ncbi:MAG TPA: tRNA (adenosine(37)-N6)-threonylcarbamoyltransferase complex dimerization subunit type 1 TsaB [Anaerohalosphaeraceae bacterium]|nr:tRNA (adenosine(37)-N6)-threonylcarbamoyltransferase complex dimerization subunit type 1 TsaB [Phycisphaerae bacterium]HOK96353.1 tRNA (adenosine(37)-N6)-threonylcarbamoyltransferase complex dimerization subunit type 1 TsaB [Anaerohalosphaeraceae bacterium]HOL32044.1 tRNA (adenosine(37)-N6)-threonylcarbamoyltransferase complex dimerization subunit type 1 TsaB [Anaerohalosphaeraceae bacterium]HOM76272.1 tRNA (adenosine(37)-N6)-threonylcarbamoyltransferase complex dimerization subunit type 1 Ts
MTDSQLILAIETSGRTGSAAIGRDDTLAAQIVFSGFMRHSAELFGAIEELLRQAGAVPSDIRQVYITGGPGSFTGLRIAVTAAKMLAFALKSRIIAADSMDVLAENGTDYILQTGQMLDSIVTVLDAKKDFFYTAVYDWTGNGWEKKIGTEMTTAEQLLDRLAQSGRKNVGLLGEGLLYYADKFKSPFTCLLDKAFWPATAGGLYRVGRRLAALNRFADPLSLTPFYIRKPDAVMKK